jgi:glyoxylase-like metal-dependent hydrolase (beta-lactamase superfamily II)
MANDDWKVLKHEPIEKLTENLWRVEGTLPSISLRRVMAVVRLSDGRLVVHSPISLDEAGMKELDAWGKVAFIVVPNGFHRLDAPAWKKRYPEARVLAPRGSRKKIEEKLTVDGDATELSDPSLRVFALSGIKDSEVALVVESKDGASVIVNDAVFNMDMPSKLFDRLIVSAMGSAPGPRVSRLFKMLGVKDKAAFKADLEKLAATPRLQRLIVAHTKMATGPDASAALTKAATFV